MKRFLNDIFIKTPLYPLMRFFYDRIRRGLGKCLGIDARKAKIMCRQKQTLPPLLEAEKEKLLSLPVKEVIKKSGERLNVLQVSTYDNLGGAAVVAWRLHNTYKKKGHDSVMFVNQKLSNDNNVISIRNAKKDDLFKDLCVKEGWQYWNYLSTFDLPQIEQFEKADIVHFHNLHGDYFNYFALPGLTRLKPSVWTLHDMQSITGHCAFSLDCVQWETGCEECLMLTAYPSLEKDTARRILQDKQEVYRQSDFTIVVPSRWLFDIAKRSVLADKDIRLIYNGIDVETFCPYPKVEMRKKFDIPPGATVFITSAAGGIKNPQKGELYLLEALSKAQPKDKVVCVSIGDKHYNPRIDGVKWINTGHIFSETEIARWYSAADMLLFPSIAENCPLAVIEAMACGLPVVAFKTGGIPELVSHMETGYIAEYKKVEDFLKGIELFTCDKEFREKAGRLGRAKVEKNFSLEMMANSYIELYYEVIDKRLKSRLIGGSKIEYRD